MGAPFERTMMVANGLSIIAQAMKDNPRPPFEEYAHLSSLMMNDMAAQYEDIAAAMVDEDRKVALIQFGLMPQLFYAFDCAPLCLEFYPPFLGSFDQNVVYEFLESAEEAGVPPETCSTDRFIIGAALTNELPNNSFFDRP